jgi:putative nucleotidyltransferase with HDIG domain
MPAVAASEVLSEIARQAADALHAAAARVFVADADHAQLRLAASYGEVAGDDTGEQLARRAIAHGAPCESADGGRFERGADRLTAGGAAPIGSSGALWVCAPSPRQFDDRDLAELSRMATIAAAALPTAMTGVSVSAVVGALAALLDLRDGYATPDAQQMVRLTREIGQRVGMDRPECSALELAARLHDIGKIGVPDRILHKAGRLEPHERIVVQRHPVWGAEALARVRGLEHVAEVVRSHHERWDGAGYPAGLAGEDIPLASRVIAPCDVYRAMTSERPYRRPLPPPRALAAIQAASGTSFDPQVVSALLGVLAADGLTPEPQGGEQRPQARASVGGYGARLASAMQRLDMLPALAEARDRLLGLLASERPLASAIVTVVESDLALVVALLRAANHSSTPSKRIGSVPAAVAALRPEGVEILASRIAVTDVFEHPSGWGMPLERVRLHAVAVQRAADRIVLALGWDDRDELLVAALLHDIGKLALARAADTYPDGVHGDARTPDERVRAERHALGADHAAISGVVLRRWRLPERIAVAVEDHHSPAADGWAAVVGLADLLVHHHEGHPIDRRRLTELAATLGLENDTLRSLTYDLRIETSAQPRQVEPCPLTPKELEVMRLLAKGLQYKAIADELGTKPSTVRSHMFHAYHRIGVGDRAQAVLHCTERGWL